MSVRGALYGPGSPWSRNCITQGKKWFRDGSATIPCRQRRFLAGNESNAVLVMDFKKKFKKIDKKFAKM